jgi:hypothetical protein
LLPLLIETAGTPILALPPQFGQTATFQLEEISRYDDRGPAWYWNNFRTGEHTGTHFDAPNHWVTGQSLDDVAAVPAARLIGPAVVIDRVAEAAGDPDYLLDVADITAWEAEHGALPAGGWLIYRCREKDMPLAHPPDNATPEQLAKTESIRQKMLRLARDKYLFRFQERRVTTGFVVENGRLAGLKVAETRVEGRKADPIQGSEHELRAPLVISSIGSVPESIPGIAMKGEYYTFQNDALPQYTGSERVFGVGNVVTGQGNIRVSLVHSREVTTQLIEDYIGVGNGDSDFHALHAHAEARGAAQAEAVEERVRALPSLSEIEIAKLEQRIRTLQERVGYTGDYDSWIARETPPDLE